jgi:hypothetical protein
VGNWGPGAFDNDAALDWIGELELADVEYVRDALAGVAESDDEDLEADECRTAVAAAEIVAAARGRAPGALPPEVASWLAAHGAAINAADAAAARDVIARIATHAAMARDSARSSGALGDLARRLDRG